MEIIKHPKVLRQVSKPISDPNQFIDLINEMFKFLKNQFTGVGLSAIQIGIPIRLFVVRFYDPKVGYVTEAFMNPEVIERSGTKYSREGCMSLPDVYETIERSSEITVKYINFNGTERVDKFKGNFARIIQHELDHLDGILFIDHLPKVRKHKLRHKLKDYFLSKV